MAASPVGRLALFSIKPSYANAILSGDKKVEFRRRPIPDDVSHVVIYATSPVQQVVGVFEVEAVESTSPTQAWERYAEVGGIDRPAFDAYYHGAAAAHVIRIRRAQAAARPFDLAEIDAALRAPQSFVYLREDRRTRTSALLRGASESASRSRSKRTRRPRPSALVEQV